MYVKCLVIDGFKSYANRVEITGFDKTFNAITGLNGTGKSNILDAVCFVLGITNLANVRAASLQELIYKGGNAGVTKCSVSITFDNSNPAQCPIGYESCKEITVTRMILPGGKSKYILNGVSVQNKKIADLFGSVQLNVNNPNFLIMQGRITTVNQMKPLEMLSLVEEAAGTRMYESKKQAAQNTIEKKKSKLQELNSIITEEIRPKLDKLKDDRAKFQEHQKVVRELEALQKLNTAWRFVGLKEDIEKSQEKMAQIEAVTQTKKDSIQQNELRQKELKKELHDLKKKIQEESSSILSGLAEEMAEAGRAADSAGSSRKADADKLADIQKSLKQLKKTYDEDCLTLADKKTECGQETAKVEEFREAAQNALAALEVANKMYVAVSTGAKSTSGDTVQQRIIKANSEMKAALTRVSAYEMDVKHREKELKTLQRQIDECPPTRDTENAARETQLEKLVNTLREQLATLESDSRDATELATSIQAASQEVRTAGDRLERMNSQLHYCNFVYNDPVANFDRNKVFGTVCQLVKVDDLRFCAALDAVAGGKLNNVVVDEEYTGRLLLKHSALRNRVTFIPLDKIVTNVMEPRRLAKAQQIGGGVENVQLALNLVTYPEGVRRAMQWVFGNTLVCRDTATAKAVCFHPDILRRCVTMDGDVFDPAGLISGGSRTQNRSVLERLSEKQQLQESLERAQSHQAELGRQEAAAARYNKLKKDYEAACESLEQVRKDRARTPRAKLLADKEAVEAVLRGLREDIARDRELAETSRAAQADMEEQMRDLTGFRDRECKQALDVLDKARAESEALSARSRAHETALDVLTQELGPLEAATVSASAQLEELGQELVAARERLAAADKLLAEKKAILKEVRSRHDAQRDVITASDSTVGRLEREATNLAKELGDLKLSLTEHETTTEPAVRAHNAQLMKQMEAFTRANPWVESEQQYFGVAGSLYDFQERGAATSAVRLQGLEQRREQLSRGLNARAHTLLGKEEEQFKEVLHKKTIIENDRRKLEEVIAQLDDNKRKKLVAACEQVSKDFGSIYEILLPGSQAALLPPSEGSVLNGLEMGVWMSGRRVDRNLLSGGQRSLLALSLILAMLRFRPAPLYILDEIDSALDLSHTQNIGHMLATHFRNSQFLIVSLKDGLFNNANVLYRTSFQDGMSSVTRTVNR